MSLIPKIEVVFDDITKTIQASDTTGFYDPVTNIEGYGAPNLARADIVTASLVIHYNKTFFYAKDVAAIIKASADPIVDLGLIPAVFADDGVYKVFLLINAFPSFGKLVFVNEEVNKQMALFWTKLACIYDVYKKKELEKECIWLESNIQAFPALERRGLESEYINLLRFVEKRFEVNQSLVI